MLRIIAPWIGVLRGTEMLQRHCAIGHRDVKEVGVVQQRLLASSFSRQIGISHHLLHSIQDPGQARIKIDLQPLAPSLHSHQLPHQSSTSPDEYKLAFNPHSFPVPIPKCVQASHLNQIWLLPLPLSTNPLATNPSKHLLTSPLSAKSPA